MDPQTHKRYLDYRQRHEYFGTNLRLLSAAEFAESDAEHRALESKGEASRDDEDDARLVELAKLLLRD